jgi:biotin synthase
LHAALDQNRQLFRGLRLLFPVGPLQDRIGKPRAHGTRGGDGTRPRRQRVRLDPLLHGRRLARRARRQREIRPGARHRPPDEAAQLRDAGVTAYNHNLDTSPEHYPNIVTSHTYEDRLRTIRAVQDAGISVCCGGILGLSETIADRLRLLEVISTFNPHPESVPINSLMPQPGTPLADNPQVEPLDVVRMVACARIAVPTAKVRLSAGRSRFSDEAQALCFFAGANSIFYGERLLTTENPSALADRALLAKLGLETMDPDVGLAAPAADPAQPAYP